MAEAPLPRSDDFARSESAQCYLQYMLSVNAQGARARYCTPKNLKAIQELAHCRPAASTGVTTDRWLGLGAAIWAVLAETEKDVLRVRLEYSTERALKADETDVMDHTNWPPPPRGTAMPCGRRPGCGSACR